MTTENEKDEAVSARYRELRRGEPPARLDDAILAASRRAVHSAPGRSASRWAVPVSLAAAVVLSVLVSLNVREQRPDLESPSTVAQAPSAPAPAAPPPVEAKPVVEPKPEAAPAPVERKASIRNELRPQPQFAPEPGPVAAAKPADAASAPAPVLAAPAPPSTAGAGAATGELASPAPARAMARSAPAEMRDRADAMAKRAEDVTEAPERTLERIAALRIEGKHVEAERLLAEFRQRYPQYRIPEAMLEKVNPPR